MKYPKVKDGGLIQPRKRNYKMACCDCGLVHRINFRVRVIHGGESHLPIVAKGSRLVVQFHAYRDNRATGAIRRGLESIRVIKRRKAK